MAYEQRENSGSLFRTEKENDRQPDYSGSGVIDGIPYWIDGWVKQPKDATKKKFLSLSFKPKQQHRDEQRGERTERPKPQHAPPPPPPPPSSSAEPAKPSYDGNAEGF